MHPPLPQYLLLYILRLTHWRGRTGEMSQQLRVLAALPEDPLSVFSTYINWVFNYSSRESNVSGPWGT